MVCEHLLLEMEQKAEKQSNKKFFHSIFKHDKFQSTLDNVIHQKIEFGLVPFIHRFSESGFVLDIQDVFQRLNFDITCRVILGFDPNALAHESDHHKALDEIEDCIGQRYLVPEFIRNLKKWLCIGEEKRFLAAWKDMDRFLYDCISLRRETLSENNNKEKQSDLLTSFLVEEEYDVQIGGISTKSDKFIRDMTLNLLIAGRDTISSALTSLIRLVSNHPSVENKIVEEIKLNLPNNGNFFTNAREVNNLVYLHAVICETLRLYPPVPSKATEPSQSDILPSGHPVDENTTVFLCTYAMGRMEDIWGRDCLEFRPERWISDRGSIVYVPSYKFPAFSAGPRSCLGKNMAFVQIKMIASALIWRYRIQVVEGQSVSIKNSLVLHLEHGLKVRVSKRQAS